MGQGRRQVSSPVNPMLPATKYMVVEELSRRGFVLQVRKENHGEWNEYRDFLACRSDDGDAPVHLDRVMKSEKPDWQAMLDQVMAMENERGADQ